MNLALIGYGRMGREIEQVASEKGLKILKTFTSENNEKGAGLTRTSLAGVDVCIDCSTPEAVCDNIAAAADCGKNIVVGTTGWYSRLEEVRRIVKQKKIGLLYATNFSLGVNIFTQIVMDAAHLIDRYPEYDVALHEIHHRGKADSPSGTALSLGSVLMQTMRRKSEILHETSHGAIKPGQLHMSSLRVGNVAGRHAVMFDSEYDTIELVHTARSRRGFAVGAVVAAQWLKGKKGCYTMRDVILPGQD